MEIEEYDKEDTEEEYEEVEVDYQEEFLGAIEVIIRETKKKKKLQEELDKKEDN
jgi:hypothetical protein